jgi:hypothetical protein
MPQVLGQSFAKASANAYASVFPAPLLGHGDARCYLVHLIEKNVNAVTVQIRGSNNGVTWENVGAEISLAKGEHDYEVVDEPWLFLDPQLKSTVADTAGSLTTIITEG